MKKTKKWLALLTAAVMVFGTAFTALAEETEEQQISTVQYEDLQYSAVQYKTYQSRVLGEYPDVKGVAGLTDQIKKDIDDAYNYEKDENDENYENDSSTVVFTVADEGQYGVVTVLLTIDRASDSAFRNKEIALTYYIDKTTMSVVDEAAYLASVPAEGEEAAETEVPEAVETGEEVTEEVPETEAVEEPAEAKVYAITLRTIVDLGYELAWDGETKTVTITLGEYSTTVTIGVNAYESADGVIALDMAPYIENDLTYVPVTFFEKVLGLAVSVDEAGNVTLAVPTEEVVVDEEVPGDDAAAEEAPADEEAPAEEAPADEEAPAEDAAE